MDPIFKDLFGQDLWQPCWFGIESLESLFTFYSLLQDLALGEIYTKGWTSFHGRS